MSGGGDASVQAGNGVGKAAFSLSGGGDLNLSIRADELAVSVGGGGDAMLEGAADDFACTMKNGGDLDAADFTAKDASLKLTGGSSAKVRVEGSLEVEASGGGDVWVSGNPEIRQKLSGGSEIHHK